MRNKEITQLVPGERISDGGQAITIQAQAAGGRVLAMLPDNTITPYVVWRSYDKQDSHVYCFSGEYFFPDQLEQAVKYFYTGKVFS